MSEVPAMHTIAQTGATGKASPSMVSSLAVATSGRAHVYMSEYKYGDEGYRSGLRGKCPIEIKVAIGQAVKGGIIIAKTKHRGSHHGRKNSQRLLGEHL